MTDGSRRRGGALPYAHSHRPHRARRRLRITVAYDEAEHEAVLAAAVAAGRSPTSFVADAAISAASGSARPRSDSRDVLLELMSARAQLRRYGNNLNQIARVLNAGGDTPEWLTHAVQLTNTAVARIDTTVGDLTKSTGRP